MAELDALAGEWPRLVCDEPAEDGTLDDLGAVSGWAYSPVGIREVAAWLNGRPLDQVVVGGERPDVADACPDWPGALRSGFQFRRDATDIVPLGGVAEVRIVAEDESGRRAELHRVIRVVEPPQRSRPLPPIVLVLDEPAESAPVARGSFVGGWAYSPAGIREVTVRLDGRVVGQAVTDRERPDVVTAHPNWPGALRSGFRLRLDVAPAPPLPRPAELWIVAEDEQGRHTEVRRAVLATELAPPAMAGSIDVPKKGAFEEPLRDIGWSSPLLVCGWAIDVDGVERIDVLLDGQPVVQAEHGFPREDVALLRPDYRSLGLTATAGWVAVVETEGYASGEHSLTATVHGRSGTLALGPTSVRLRAESVRADRVRQRRLEALLRCPKCGQPFRGEGNGLVCVNCGHRVRSNEFGTLLLDETYAGLDWRQPGATSHGYEPEAVDLIKECAHGLVLQVGAGLREILPNVIQLDAIAFPTTDVAANAEALPFADQSFDGVVALNLLEHVSDPKAVVSEMRRVCKLGGRLYADFTSVHPYHGFPHHYFNATETGLDWLMREVGGAVGTVGLSDARLTVRMVLQQWLGSLEDMEARTFVEGLTVDDLVLLLADPSRNPQRYAALDRVSPDYRRLIPPKVTFTGVRTG